MREFAVREPDMIYLVLFLLAVIVALAPALGSAESPRNLTEKGFRQPPDSAKPQVYWQWINGNVTREDQLRTQTLVERIAKERP